MKTITKIGFVLAVLLLCYIGSYVALSLSGRYEPSAIGLNGVKGYGWAPTGFVRNYKWNMWLQLFYLPLWAVDMRVWHSPGKAYTERYPIDYVAQKDIWKVYKAWDTLTETKLPPKKPEKKHAAPPEPQAAKDAIIALVRQRPEIFIGCPDPNRLTDCPLQHLDAQRWQFGNFEFDLRTMTYSAMIGGDAFETPLYAGILLRESGRWVAQPPSHAALHPANRKQSLDDHRFPDSVERAMMIEASRRRPRETEPPDLSESHKKTLIIRPADGAKITPSRDHRAPDHSKTSPTTGK